MFNSSTALFLCCFLSTLASAEQAKVKLGSPNYWCPLVCDQSIKHPFPGIYIEIANEIWGRKGVDFQMMSYSDAIASARRGAIDAIPAAIPSEVPDFIFPSEEGSEVKWCFWGRKKSKAVNLKMQDLTKLSLALIEDYVYPPKFSEFLKENESRMKSVTRLKGNDVLKRINQMILDHRQEYLLEGQQAVKYYLSRGVLKDLHNKGCLDEIDKAYMAFSAFRPKRSSRLAEEYDKGIRKMRANGRLKEILSHYGSTDWKK